MKEFYTFAEISNIKTRLDSMTPETEYAKKFVDEKKEMIRKLVMDMQDEKTAFAFVRYHLHGEGDGKQKLYVKK